jgi:hypothetical protein
MGLLPFLDMLDLIIFCLLTESDYIFFFFLKRIGNIIQNSQKTIDNHKEGETSSLLTIPQILGGIVVHLIVPMTWVLASTASS